MADQPAPTPQLSTKPSPFLLMDPERSLRAFVAGSPATIPPWWLETDEDVVCRNVAAQLGTNISPQIPLLVDMLWGFSGRGLRSVDPNSVPNEAAGRIPREARD